MPVFAEQTLVPRLSSLARNTMSFGGIGSYRSPPWLVFDETYHPVACPRWLRPLTAGDDIGSVTAPEGRGYDPRCTRFRIRVLKFESPFFRFHTGELFAIDCLKMWRSDPEVRPVWMPHPVQAIGPKH